MAGLANPGLLLIIAETEVFSGAAPTTWTDLNLSAVVGLKATLVFLKFKGDGTQQVVAVRRNGDTDEFYETGQADMLSGTQFALGVGAHKGLLVVTDSGGKIEWRASTTDVTTIDVVAYSK